MTSERREVLDALQRFLSSKKEALLTNYRDLEASNASNTKSTAGDKHDTEREMAQQEMNTVMNSLDNLTRMQHALDTWMVAPAAAHVNEGSIVHTDKGMFFVGIALGKVPLGDGWVLGVSALSPLGKALIGKSIGEVVSVNGRTYKVLKVG